MVPARACCDSDHFYGFPSMYYWPLNGLDLPDDILKKIYRHNALRAFEQAQRNAG